MNAPLPEHIRRALETTGIIVRCRAGGVRISPHGYNTCDEIDRMMDELKNIVEGRSSKVEGP